MLNKLRNLNFFLLVCGVVFFAACNSSKVSKDSAAKTLSDYVAQSFAVKTKPEKAQLLQLTTGGVREHIEKMTDAEFKSVFEDKSREFVSLKIRDERQVQENEYSITYEITYISKGPAAAGSGEPEVDKVTNKKHALFKKEGGSWLISEVKNLKTTIEHQNAMTL